MSKADFWYLIEETRTSCGEDQKTYLRHLGEWLKALGPDYAQDFHDILHAYVELADKLGLWSAATLMGRSSEHDFENFRSWLISHGQDVYPSTKPLSSSVSKLSLRLRCNLFPFLVCECEKFPTKYSI